MLAYLALFIILFTLAIFLAWPQASIYALAASLPVIGWQFYWRGYILPLTDLVAVLALTAFFIRVVLSWVFGRNKIRLKWPLFFPFAIFIAINLLSCFVSADILSSLWYVARWPLLLYFAYIFLPYNLITNSKILKKTIIALAFSSFIVLISGFASLYGQNWHDSFFRIRSISIFGIFPFGENHNLVAEFLNVGAFLFLTLKEWANNQRSKKIWNIFFLITCLGIIMTFSRAGWVTLALQLVIYSGYYFQLHQTKRLPIILSSIIILVLLFPLFLKMDQLQQDNISSTEDRLLLTEISVTAFKNKPYLGYGSGQFINLVDNNVRFKAKYGDPIDSHGMIQKILAENGIFGLASWFFVLIYLIKVGLQSLKRYYRINPWILPLYLGGFGGLFFQFFNTSYYKGKVWLPIAVSLATIRLMEEKYGKKEQTAD